MANQRKNFLINRKFQFRFSFYVCSWIFALSMAFPLMISQIFELFGRYATLDPLAAPVGIIYATREQVFWILVGMQAVFLLVVFIISLFMAHRIAGPVHKFKNALQSAGTGNFDLRLVFRKTDHFSELAHGFNQMSAEMDSLLAQQTEKALQTSALLKQVLEQTPPPSQQPLEQSIALLQKIGKKLP